MITDIVLDDVVDIPTRYNKAKSQWRLGIVLTSREQALINID